MKQEFALPSLYPGCPSGQFGRVPGRVPNYNLSNAYLSSLNNAAYYETHPTLPMPPRVIATPQRQQQLVRGGQSLSPASSGARSSGGTNQFMSSATIVSNAVSTQATLPAAIAPREVVIATARKSSSGPAGIVCKSSPCERDRIPSSIMLSPAQQREGMIPPKNPVPEFLCHLYSMLKDPALAGLISWIVPLNDETNDLGGGKAGIGKIVVHDPTRLQDEILGKYYRHSRYSSFQRQLNYFGFKKRLHGSKKGKMCICSFVHDTLSPDPHSLLVLKRRPPSGRRITPDSTIAARQQKQGGKSSGAHSKTGRYLKKGKKRGPALLSNVSSGDHLSPALPMTTNNDNSNENAPWWRNTNQGGIAPAPLHMPLTAQATATFPGNMTPTFPTKVDNMIYSSPTKNDGMSALRANNAVLEAKKSLARNFLKSQQERQKPVDGEQKQQPALHKTAVIFQQPQPQAKIPARGLIPAASTAAAMSGGVAFSHLPTTKLSLSAVRAHNKNNLEKQQLPTYFTPIEPTLNTFNHIFPDNHPMVVNNTSTNYLMASIPTAVPITSNRFETLPQGMTVTSPVQPNKPLSNHLNTSLPPFQELFDDDYMSTGSMSDFGATALQVANDSSSCLEWRFD